MGPGDHSWLNTHKMLLVSVGIFSPDDCRIATRAKQQRDNFAVAVGSSSANNGRATSLLLLPSCLRHVCLYDAGLARIRAANNDCRCCVVFSVGDLAAI